LTLGRHPGAGGLQGVRPAFGEKSCCGAEERGVPVIYFVNECAALLRELRKTGADIIGIDWRIDLKDAIKGLGKKCVVQGNLDPCALFLPQEKMEDKVKDILWKGEFCKRGISSISDMGYCQRVCGKCRCAGGGCP